MPSQSSNIVPSPIAEPMALQQTLDTLVQDYNRPIGSNKIEDSAITSAKISDSAVTTAKINDSAVTTAKINDSAVTSAKIADGTIVNADIATNAAIDLSKLATSAWSAWNTTYGGFSVNPTQDTRYIKIGRLVVLLAAVPSVSGTSNATTFTMTLPFASAHDIRFGGIYAVNSGSSVTGRADFAASSTTLTLLSSVGGATWTASGNKFSSFILFYEATS